MKKDNSEAHNFVFEREIITVSLFAQGILMRPGESEGRGGKYEHPIRILPEVTRAGAWSHSIHCQATHVLLLIFGLKRESKTCNKGLF